MTIADLPDGEAVFVDAHTLIDHFAADSQYGAAWTDLVKRIERQELSGFSSHIVSEVAHRLMTIEAILLFAWPVAGIAQRLRRHLTTEMVH